MWWDSIFHLPPCLVIAAYAAAVYCCTCNAITCLDFHDMHANPARRDCSVVMGKHGMVICVVIHVHTWAALVGRLS